MDQPSGAPVETSGVGGAAVGPSQEPPPQFLPENRKIFLINPRFQLSVLGFMVGMSALAIVIFYGANAYFFYKFAQTGRALGLPPEHVFFQFLREQNRDMNWIFGITSVMVLATLSLGGLILSHRVAGPLYRLRRHMQDVAEGRTTADVRFRRKDFFPEIAEWYNRQLRTLLGARGSETGAPAGEKPDARTAA